MFTRSRLASAGVATALVGALLGPNPAAATVGQLGPVARSAEIVVWMNAFIPDSLPGARPVTAGAHAGTTVFPGPFPGRGCFATDQRGFSTDSNASARLHAEVRFKVVSSGVDSRAHRSTATLEVDCGTGSQRCLRTATPSGRFTGPPAPPFIGNSRVATVNAAQSATVLDVTAAASNPCFAGSPNVDLNGRLEIAKAGSKVRVTFVGKAEAFPNFEMYASLAGGTPQRLFQRSQSGGLLSLFGSANVPVHGTVLVQLP